MSTPTALWQPTLVGTRVTLRPIVADDFDALFARRVRPGDLGSASRSAALAA
jgi:hypothetical protein